MVSQKYQDALRFVKDLSMNIDVLEKDRGRSFITEQQSSNCQRIFLVGRWDGSGRLGIPYASITIIDLPEISYCGVSLVPFFNSQSTLRRLFLEQDYCFDSCEQIAHGNFKSMNFEKRTQWMMN